MTINERTACLALFMASIAGCCCGPKPADAPKQNLAVSITKSILSYKLREDAHDGIKYHPTEGNIAVDANSVLVVEFELENGQNLPAEAGSKRASPAPAAALPTVSLETDPFDQIKNGVENIINPAAHEKAAYDNRAHGPERVRTTLTPRQTVDLLNKIVLESEKFIQVIAYVASRGKQDRQIHVDNYDIGDPGIRSPVSRVLAMPLTKAIELQNYQARLIDFTSPQSIERDKALLGDVILRIKSEANRIDVSKLTQPPVTDAVNTFKIITDNSLTILVDAKPGLDQAVADRDKVKDLAALVEEALILKRRIEIAEDIKGKVITRPIRAGLPNAYIRLENSGVQLGDLLRIIINLYDREPSQADPGNPAQYIVSANLSLAGLYTVLSPALIIARAAEGRESNGTQWKPNVAAIVNWHYQFREDREGSLGPKIWNAVAFGAGAHIASLDMTDDNAEIGIGPNISLLGGMLSFGYGWNLSRRHDREYYFVGLDLWEVFKKARETVQPAF